MRNNQARVERIPAFHAGSIKKDLTLEQASATIVSVSESPTSDVVGLVEGVEDLTPLEIELGTISF